MSQLSDDEKNVRTYSLYDGYVEPASSEEPFFVCALSRDPSIESGFVGADDVDADEAAKELSEDSFSNDSDEPALTTHNYLTIGSRPNEHEDSGGDPDDGSAPTVYTYGCPLDEPNGERPCSGTFETTKDYGDTVFRGCPECERDVSMQFVSAKEVE